MNDNALNIGKGKKIERAIMTIPTMLWMILFVAVPILYIFIMSFLQQGDFSVVKFVFTLGNYQNIFTPLTFLIFVRSILIAALTTAICLLIAYPFAFFIAQKSQIVKIISMALVMVPFMVSSLIRLFSWTTILRRDGLLNVFLIKLGLFIHLYRFATI